MRFCAYFCVFIVGASAAFGLDAAAEKTAADFARKAAVANLFEIEAARIELRNGKAQEARDFAEQMLADHGRAAGQLETAAEADGIALPAELDEEHKNKLVALEQSEPANLDQAYLSTQLTAHEQAVALFEAYVAGGPEGRVKQAAAEILPDLREHLQHVQQLTSR